MATNGNNNSKLRADLLNLVMSDRSLARQEGNSAAAIVASSKAIDLLLGRYAEEGATAQPITAITHHIVHMTMCPICRETQDVSAAPPLDPVSLPPERRASAWA